MKAKGFFEVVGLSGHTRLIQANQVAELLDEDGKPTIIMADGSVVQAEGDTSTVARKLDAACHEVYYGVKDAELERLRTEVKSQKEVIEQQREAINKAQEANLELRSKLQVAQSRKKMFRYKVVGSGSFPLDMLRYDMCWPRNPYSAMALKSTEAREVQLLSIEKPSKERWMSFNWTVHEVEEV